MNVKNTDLLQHPFSQKSSYVFLTQQVSDIEKDIKDLKAKSSKHDEMLNKFDLRDKVIDLK